MTDVELDERVTALEGNGGGGHSLNGKTNMSHLGPIEKYYNFNVLFKTLNLQKLFILIFLL